MSCKNASNSRMKFKALLEEYVSIVKKAEKDMSAVARKYPEMKNHPLVLGVDQTMSGLRMQCAEMLRDCRAASDE